MGVPAPPMNYLLKKSASSTASCDDLLNFRDHLGCGNDEEDEPSPFPPPPLLSSNSLPPCSLDFLRHRTRKENHNISHTRSPSS